jgi:hypothetical protein
VQPCRREQITHQARQAVVGCGFDENLQQGASYFQRSKYLSMMRVIAENFAAKLPPSPQLTVPEHSSSGSQSKNVKSSRNPASPYSKHPSWKKGGFKHEAQHPEF